MSCDNHSHFDTHLSKTNYIKTNSPTKGYFKDHALLQMPSLSSQFNTMSISTSWLYQQILNNSSSVLLLDCRPYNEYSQSYIHTALNLAVPSLMLRRLKKGCSVNFANMINTEEGKRRFAKRDLMDKIVIYDGSTENLTNTALELILQRLTSEGLNNVLYLKGKTAFLYIFIAYSHMGISIYETYQFT